MKNLILIIAVVLLVSCEEKKEVDGEMNELNNELARASFLNGWLNGFNASIGEEPIREIFKRDSLGFELLLKNRHER